MRRTPQRNIDTVLFDLDGTLADTAPDMIAALSRLSREQDRAPVNPAVARGHVSRGAAGLLRLAFGHDVLEDEFERLRTRFLQIYAADLCVETRLFPGMRETLGLIERLGLKWGVVTNKPAWLTDSLIDELGLTSRAACVISGDTTDQRKPHPKPLLHACACCASDAAQCVYVGDDPRDIQAGAAAGMTTLVALYGYIAQEQDPYTWGAHGVLADITELPAWLRANAGAPR
ncbi:MAG: HAD family hydrolase [Gammaproteobacteria bacterium]